MGSTPRLSRPLVFSALFCLFILAFIVTPLWNFLPGRSGKAAGLLSTLAAALLWARFASGTVRVDRQALWLIPCLALAWALNARALTAPIPWRGDEDYHIRFTRPLVAALARHAWYLLVPAAFLAWSARRNRLPWFAAMLVAAAAAWAAHATRLDFYQAVRYPFVSKYFSALPVWLFSFVLSAEPHEFPFRLVPLFSVAALAYLCARALRCAWPIRVCAAVFVATLPLVRYYGSILYLEMPAAACMTAVCLQRMRLLRADPDRLPRLPAWYALLLIGFIKETAAPFLAAFILCRFIGRRRRLLPAAGQPPPWGEWGREARVVACACLPLLAYLVYRRYVGVPRAFVPHLGNLQVTLLWRLQSRSWLETLGPLLPLAAGGLALGLFRRRWLSTAFPILACGLDALLHLLDYGQYVGYSRFNLFLLPGLLALAWEALHGLRRRPGLAPAALAAGLAANVWLSPLNADGTKRPGWGVYAEDVGEHYYPYREALTWLRDHPGKAKLTGLDYPYYAEFYLGPGAAPLQSLVERGDDAAVLDSVLAASQREGFAAVLYQPGGLALPDLRDVHGYAKRTWFRNQAHALVIFSR